MSHFRLHMKEKEKHYLLAAAAGILLAAVVAGYVAHSIGTARAKSRETVLIYTEEELEQYLLDTESEEYNLNGNYRLEEDLELGWLYQSIGTNAEPFTGSIDGNGHVISGLTRPLFGVLENAKVENLFLSGADITHPSIYFDGERYGDGYGALAAYAVGTEIENCGMEGEIHTQTPIETGFLLEKASPADAEEEKEEKITKEVEESWNGVGWEGEQTSEGGQTGEPGLEGNKENGPGMENEPESDVEAGTNESKSEEIESGGRIEAESGAEVEAGEENSSNEGTEAEVGGNAGAEPEIGTEEITGAEPEIGTEEITGAEPGTETGENTGAESEAGTKENIGAEPEMSAGEHEESVTGMAVRSAAGTAPTSETVGFQLLDRQYLKLKVPPLPDRNAELAGGHAASPPDAVYLPEDSEQKENGTVLGEDDRMEHTEDGTPSGPEEEPVSLEFSAGITVSGKETETSAESEEGIEYIGNPNGDISTLVTAERVNVGGLIAEMAGDSILSNSFVLVTVDSGLETVDTYVGGMIGIINQRSRLENSYAAGLADADGVTGGFVAVNNGTIQNCYCTMTIGARGTIRRAFMAEGEGVLTSCVYDRQMSCSEETDSIPEELEVSTPTEALNMPSEPEFSLKGLNTNRMTGVEAEIPGNWYLVEHAYPQLEYFASSDREVIESSSRAAAIALILPENTTLKDILEEGNLVLPAEIDGHGITWEAEGNITINGNNQVIMEQNVSISANEIPRVKSILDMEPALENGGSERTEKSEETEESEEIRKNLDETVKLRASVGGVRRNFTVQAMTPRTTSYVDWGEVGRAVDTGGVLESYQPSRNGDYFEIGTPEALAWIAYKVNMGDATIQNASIRLTADINLDGKTDYGGSKVNPLLWIPIGTSTNPYKGIFEGNGHSIDYLKVEQKGYAGLFGCAGGGQ